MNVIVWLIIPAKHPDQMKPYSHSTLHQVLFKQVFSFTFRLISEEYVGLAVGDYHTQGWLSSQSDYHTQGWLSSQSDFHTQGWLSSKGDFCTHRVTIIHIGWLPYTQGDYHIYRGTAIHIGWVLYTHGDNHTHRVTTYTQRGTVKYTTTKEFTKVFK